MYVNVYKILINGRVYNEILYVSIEGVILNVIRLVNEFSFFFILEMVFSLCVVILLKKLRNMLVKMKSIVEWMLWYNKEWIVSSL